MPELELSNLNIILTILGLFVTGYAFLSKFIKQVWYLGEALPAVIVGIALGQIGSRWIDPRDWGLGHDFDGRELQNSITLGVCRVVIGVQLVIVGFALPARYQWERIKPMAICLLGVMTIMWLCSSACVLAAVPNVTVLSALVIGSCVACTDPILSQAIAKGPFSDKYVRRPLREIISSEAGANDGFGFPFLMLAVYLIRHAANPDYDNHSGGIGLLSGVVAAPTIEEAVGRLGGGVGVALQKWLVETWIYFILLSIIYGAVCGILSMYATKFALRERWIDGELYLLWPAGLGLFIVGTGGLLGTDDLLACFVAGNCLNWNGQYLAETQARHDEVNNCIDTLLNFGGFMYIGAILPWDQFSNEATGLTYGRLIGLGVLILVLRRIPAILVFYKAMPEVCADWKEALFMGYFGPIGIGAVFYIEHTRELFPAPGAASTVEENKLTAVMVPVVYWLVLFSIVVHGLSIPLLNLIYKWRRVEFVVDEDGGVETDLLSGNVSLPKNARRESTVERPFKVTVQNRFSRASVVDIHDPEFFRPNWAWPLAEEDEESHSRSQSLLDQSNGPDSAGLARARRMRRAVSTADERSPLL